MLIPIGAASNALSYLQSLLAMGTSGAGDANGVNSISSLLDGQSGSDPTTGAPPPATASTGSTVVRRADVVSRSDSRDRTDPAKTAALDTASGTAARAIAHTEDMSNGDPKSIASALLGDYGWSGSQFGCLVSLWNRESGWRVTAANPSGAYGIPQALPGSKMFSAGPDWRTDAETQIKWGLGYIKGRYSTPCDAWAHSESTGWY